VYVGGGDVYVGGGDVYVGGGEVYVGGGVLGPMMGAELGGGFLYVGGGGDDGCVVVVVAPCAVVVVVDPTVDEYSPPRQPSTYHAFRNCSVILSRGVYDMLLCGFWSVYHSHQNTPPHHDCPSNVSSNPW